MKRLLILFGGAIVLFALTGCQKPARTVPPISGVEVIIEGGGEFPQFLVGRWKDEKKGWEIVFEPDGSISWAIHTIARVRVKPGQVTTVPMRRGGKGVFEAGQWAVQYAPENRELTVEIVLEHYRAEMGEQALKGSSRDIFIGQVSEDGQEWRADWFAFPEYVVSTDIYDNYKLPVDYNYNPRSELVFKKIVESK